MVFPVALVSLWREWRFSKRLALRPALALFMALSATLALEWWASGLIGAGQNLALWGFDHFSMNLNALINPLTRSRVLPPLPTTAAQYEWFAYLGLGMLALGVLPLFLRVRARLPWWRARTPEKVGLPRRAFARLRASGHLPLALLALGFFLFSLGRSVMLGEGRLLELPLFTRLTTLTGTFRASGPFFGCLTTSFTS